MSRLRKYQTHWEVLKRDGVMAIAVTTHGVSNAQLDATFNQLKRAIQKEKYLDIHFKSKYPNASLTSQSSYDDKQIKFVLDKKDIEELLQGL